MGNKYTVLVPHDTELDFIEDSTSQINQGRLLIGPIDFIVQEGLLEELGVHCVVSCLPYAPEGIDDVLAKAGIDSHKDYRLYPLEDNTEHYVSLFSQPDIYTVTDFIRKKINEERKSVLVHCDAGVTRSAAVCVAYLMRFHELDFDGACEIIRQRRERFDICCFASELRRVVPTGLDLSMMHAMHSSFATPTFQQQRTHHHRVVFQDLDVETLRSQWSTTRQKHKGHSSMATSVVSHLPSNILPAWGESDEQRQKLMAIHLRMLHQSLWGGWPWQLRIAQLVRIHSRLEITETDMKVLGNAITKVVSQQGNSSVLWETFFERLWNVWNECATSTDTDSTWLSLSAENSAQFNTIQPPVMFAGTSSSASNECVFSLPQRSKKV